MSMLIQGRVIRIEHVEFTNQQSGEVVVFDRAHIFDGTKVHAMRLPEGVTYPVDERLVRLMLDPQGLVVIPVEAKEYKGVTSYRHAEPVAAAPAAARN